MRTQNNFALSGWLVMVALMSTISFLPIRASAGKSDRSEISKLQRKLEDLKKEEQQAKEKLAIFKKKLDLVKVDSVGGSIDGQSEKDGQRLIDKLQMKYDKAFKRWKTSFIKGYEINQTIAELSSNNFSKSKPKTMIGAEGSSFEELRQRHYDLLVFHAETDSKLNLSPLGKKKRKKLLAEAERLAKAELEKIQTNRNSNAEKTNIEDWEKRAQRKIAEKGANAPLGVGSENGETTKVTVSRRNLARLTAGRLGRGVGSSLAAAILATPLGGQFANSDIALEAGGLSAGGDEPQQEGYPQ